MNDYDPLCPYPWEYDWDGEFERELEQELEQEPGEPVPLGCTIAFTVWVVWIVFALLYHFLK